MTCLGERHRDPAGVTRPRILPAGAPAGQHGAIRPDGQPQVEQCPGGHGPLGRGGTRDTAGPQPVAVGPFRGRGAGRLGAGQRSRPLWCCVDPSGREQDAGVRLEVAAQPGRNWQRPLLLAWVLGNTGDREPGLPGLHGCRDGHRGHADCQHEGGTGHGGPPGAGTGCAGEARRLLRPKSPVAH